MVLTPQIGVFKTWEYGFSLGVDVGLQLPIAMSQIDLTTTYPSVPGVPAAVQQQANALAKQYVDANTQTAVDTLQAIGRTVIATFNVRLGWLF